MKFLDGINLGNVGPFTQFLVTAFVCGTFLGCLAMLFIIIWFKVPVEPGVREILCLLLGTLVREFGSVCGFWLGTSLGSARKTDMLNIPPQPPVKP